MTRVSAKTGVRLMWLLWLTAASVGVHAQPVDSPAAIPEYRAQKQVSGLIRTWGHGSRDRDFIGGLVRAWEAGFRKHHPAIAFETTLRGDATAIGGLYTKAADLALMERAPLAIELDGYLPIFGHDPLEVSVATGSLDVPHHNFAPVIFVHRDNPLAKLTLAQLDAVFGADHRRGAKNARTWGELGLAGEWADKPIHAHTFAIADDVSQYFENLVMGASQKWTADLHEYADLRRPDGTVVDAGEQILDALAKDRDGIAISSLILKNRQVKPLALAHQEGDPYLLATRQTVAERTYPLTRTVSVFVDRSPGQPIDPKLKEYLAYILSREGQDAIARDGGYFPLTSAMARRERSKLE